MCASASSKVSANVIGLPVYSLLFTRNSYAKTLLRHVRLNYPKMALSVLRTFLLVYCDVYWFDTGIPQLVGALLPDAKNIPSTALVMSVTPSCLVCHVLSSWCNILLCRSLATR